MTLTTDTVTLIRESWAVLARDPEALTRDFYDDLLTRAPELRPMFAGSDMPEQRRKLAAALGLVVRHADNLAPVIAPLHELGRRHAGYGVADADYGTVGAALLATIERRLGAAHSDAIRDAWASAYGAVAGTMQAGAAMADRQSA